jgi:hypothetical protein
MLNLELVCDTLNIIFGVPYVIRKSPEEDSE